MVSFWGICNQRIPTANPCNRKVALLLRLLLVAVWVSFWAGGAGCDSAASSTDSVGAAFLLERPPSYRGVQDSDVPRDQRTFASFRLPVFGYARWVDPRVSPTLDDRGTRKWRGQEL